MAKTGVLARSIQQWPVDKPIPWPGNPRRGDVNLIAQSIEVNGFYQPIVVQKRTGYVIAGNHRLAAARQIKMAEIPVVVLDVDDEQARRMVLVDNRAADKATYDADALVDLLGQFDLDDLEGTGWTEDEVDDLLTPDALSDEPEPEPEADEQMGGLEFRVVVDCQSEQDQAQLIETLEAEGRVCRPMVS